MLVLVVLYLGLRRIPWVLWHQDVQTIALNSFAGNKLSRVWVVAARVIGVGERWCARRAAHVVVIADSFVAVHRAWGTADKTTVIPNWAPLDEIVPVDRDNVWSRERGLSGTKTLVYSGTLGLKHNPDLLVELTQRVRQLGIDVRLVVVNEGPAEEILRASAMRREVPLTYLPFQPYGLLSEVLGSGDALVVLLEKSAGAFSVPSKTLSYLCAARPVVGLMPHENLASQLLEQAGWPVFPPTHSRWTRPPSGWWRCSATSPAPPSLGASARGLAESEFSLDGCVDSFESILLAAGDSTGA